MNQQILMLLVVIGLMIAILPVMLVLQHFFVNKKMLRKISAKNCPDCKRVIGNQLKMEQRFSDVDKREKAKLPFKLNGTPFWPVTCPHCHTRFVYSFTKEAFEPW